MTIHADDVARAIVEGLHQIPTCVPVYGPMFTGGRDEEIVIEGVGRDQIRSFRITIQVVDDADLTRDPDHIYLAPETKREGPTVRRSPFR